MAQLVRDRVGHQKVPARPAAAVSRIETIVVDTHTHMDMPPPQQPHGLQRKAQMPQLRNMMDITARALPGKALQGEAITAAEQL